MSKELRTNQASVRERYEFINELLAYSVLLSFTLHNLDFEGSFVNIEYNCMKLCVERPCIRDEIVGVVTIQCLGVNNSYMNGYYDLDSILSVSSFVYA